MSWYDDYLETDHWKEIRAQKVVAANGLCERCGEGAKRRGDRWIGLHVHHLNYDRVGCEFLDDLEALCIHCHQVAHGLAEDTEANRIKVRTRLAVGVVEWFDEDAA